MARTVFPPQNPYRCPGRSPALNSNGIRNQSLSLAWRLINPKYNVKKRDSTSLRELPSSSTQTRTPHITSAEFISLGTPFQVPYRIGGPKARRLLSLPVTSRTINYPPPLESQKPVGYTRKRRSTRRPECAPTLNERVGQPQTRRTTQPTHRGMISAMVIDEKKRLRERLQRMWAWEG